MILTGANSSNDVSQKVLLLGRQPTGLTVLVYLKQPLTSASLVTSVIIGKGQQSAPIPIHNNASPETTYAYNHMTERSTQQCMQRMFLRSSNLMPLQAWYISSSPPNGVSEQLPLKAEICYTKRSVISFSYPVRSGVYAYLQGHMCLPWLEPPSQSVSSNSQKWYGRTMWCRGIQEHCHLGISQFCCILLKQV